MSVVGLNSIPAHILSPLFSMQSNNKQLISVLTFRLGLKTLPVWNIMSTFQFISFLSYEVSEADMVSSLCLGLTRRSALRRTAYPTTGKVSH